MTVTNDLQDSVTGMGIHMELRGLRPNVTSTFARCDRLLDRIVARASDQPETLSPIPTGRRLTGAVSAPVPALCSESQT